MELTKHRSILLLLFVSLFAASQSASLFNSQPDSLDITLPTTDKQCAQTCNQINSQVAFESGKTYTYNVDLFTRIHQKSPNSYSYSDSDSYSGDESEQQIQISAHADLAAYSPCELVLKLRKVHVSGVHNHWEMIQKLEQQPLHFAYEDGRIVDVCGAEGDDQWVVDVKKSILSALQMTSEDITKKQTVVETDISGQCETLYIPIQSDSHQTTIRKVKQLHKCGARHQLNTAFFPQSYGMDQVLRSSLPFLTSNTSAECIQVIKNEIVDSARCRDMTQVRPLGVQVDSRIAVKLIEKKPSLQVERLSGAFRRHRLTMSASDLTFQARSNQQNSRVYSVSDVAALLRQIGSQVQTSVSSDVPTLFYELIQSLHTLSPLDQAQLWEQVRSGELSQSPKLVDLFLDASALAGNEGSIAVLLRALQQQQISQSRANYLFGLLSFAKQPTLPAVQRLVQYVAQVQQQDQQQLVQIPRGVIFGITGFVHNFQVIQNQNNVQNPQVDQLVQQLANLLVQTLQQNLPQVSNQSQEHQLLTIAYALRNLVLVPGNQQQQQDQPQISQQLVQILQQVPYTQYNQEIRVAIVRTLAIAGIDNQIRQFLLDQVIPNTQEGIEIQIEAYRAVVLSGATQQQLQQILSFTQSVQGQPGLQDLVNYILSHQANLRSTSDPQKQTILPVNAPQFPKPSGQFLGISRNYEISYVNQGLNVGVTAETDIIYDPAQGAKYSPVPQTVSFNLTIPIGGSELQLVEVRLHQHGLEPVIARHFAQISQKGERDPWKVLKETVEYVFQHGGEIMQDNPQVHLLLQISIDGKTIILLDEQDLITTDAQQQSYIRELMNKLHTQITVDRAFAITPLDTTISFPSVNGLPVQVRLNSTVVLGLKTDLSLDIRDLSNSVANIAIFPSVASQVETAVEFFAGPQARKSVELVQSFYAAPQLNVLAQVTNGRLVTFKLNVPEQQYVLARAESQLFTRNVQGERVRMHKRSQKEFPIGTDLHVCTDSTNNVLGVVLCYDFIYSTPNSNSIDLISQITIVKTDQEMKSYELQLESPYTIEQIFGRGRGIRDQPIFGQLMPFKFVFNTPGSRIDREIVLELELPNSGSALQKEARLRVQTPWKKILAQGSVRSEPKERSASVEVSVDDRKFLQMELALETIRRGQKTEYKPRLILAMDSVLEKPVHLVGVLTASHGRKAMIHFQLEDIQQKRQYIQGTYVRERGERASAFAARTSADLMVSLVGLNAKMAGAFEFVDTLVKLDLSADYQLPSWSRKEQARIGFKVQNLSTGKMLKIVNFGQVKMSQYPKYQVRLSQNLMYAPGEQMEQDFKLGWAADDDEQIRLYQTVKKTGLRGKIDLESQTIVVLRPQNINYEVKATAALVGTGINGGEKRYQIQVSGQQRDQQSDESKFDAEFIYNHLSKSPLKMNLKAALKTAQLDIIYADALEEVSPNKFEGRVKLQITPEQKYEADYDYEIRGDLRKRMTDFEEHELNVRMQDSQSKRMYRHHGLLRMQRDNSWMARSKLSSDELGELFDSELKREAQGGKTQFHFTLIPKDIRAKIQLDSTSPSAQNGQWELSTPAWRHESQYEYSPKQSYSFSSKTKRNAENWLEIDSKADRAARSHRFALNSKPIEGEWQFELPEDKEQKAQFRVQMPESWSHQTVLSRHGQKPYVSLDSRTKFAQSNIADLSAKYDPEDEHYFRLTTPLAKTDLAAELYPTNKQLKKIDLNLEAGQYSHQSKLAIEPETEDDQPEFNFQSTTRKSGKPCASIVYKLADNVHEIELDSPQILKTEIQAQIAKQKNQKSYAKVRVGDRWDSKIELEPYKSAKVQLGSPEYEHQTELTFEPAHIKGNWRLQSETTALKKANQKYLIEAERQQGQRSAFKVNMPQFDSQLAYEHPESDLSKHAMLFQFAGKTFASPLSHKTEMKWFNQSGKKHQIRLDSQTSRKNLISGQEENLVDIEGQYNHNDEQTPSNLKLKIGKSISGNIDVSMFNPEVKTLSLNGQFTDDQQQADFRHQTEARFQRANRRLSLNSNTEKNGQILAKLDSILSGNPDEKSYITLKAGARKQVKAGVEFLPQNRRAVVDFDMAPYQHRTEFSKISGAPFLLKTVTTQNQKNLLDIDSQFAPTTTQESFFRIKANSPRNQDQLYESSILVHPGKRVGQLALRTNNLNHESEFRLQDSDQGKTALIKTNTIYKDQVLANIAAELRGLRGVNKVDAQLPQFSLNSMVDVPEKRSSFDLKHHISRRHLLGSVAVNQGEQNQFHFDLAWDVDRNPASKVQIDLTARKIPSQRSSTSFLRKSDDLIIIASTQYATNKLVLNAELVPQQAMRNPIRVSLAYVPLDSARIQESWQVIYSHTMESDSQYQCKWDFLVGEQLKYGLAVTGQVTEEKFQFGAQTQAPQKPALQVTFNLSAGVRKPGQQYYLEATALHAESARYQVTFDLTKHLETRKLDGTLELRFPNFELHTVAFTIDLVERHFKLDVTNEKTGKQVDIEASYGDNLVHLNAESNIPFFPAVDAKIRYVPGETLHAKLDLDKERKFELTAKYTGELSTLEFYALTKVDSVYTPSVEFVAEGRKSPDLEGNHERAVSISGKYNMVPVLSATFQQEDVQQWQAEAQISNPSGEKLVESSVQSIPQQQLGQQQFLVKVTPKQNQLVQPFVATVLEQQPTSANGYIRSIKIELTQPQQGQVASAQVQLKQRKWTEVPQMIEVTLEHTPSNSHGSFRLSIREQVDGIQQQNQQLTEQSLFDTTEQTTGVSSKRVVRQIRDQAVVSWNQKAAGFSLLTTQYATAGDAEEHDFKLYSPSRAGRVIQIRCAHQVSSQLFFLKQQLKTDLTAQREPIVQYTVLVQNAPESTGYTGRVQLESFKFVRSPKTVEFALRPSTPTTPLDVKLRIDVGKTERDAVTIKTVVQQQVSQNQVSIFGQVSQNNTLHFSAKSQDRTVLDFEFEGHISDSSVGFVWQNVNRRGQQQKGQYLVRFIGQDRFEAILATPTYRYLINGLYKRKQVQQGASPLVMDFVVSKLVNKQNSWVAGGRSGEPVLVAEHKVHIESVDKCIRAEIEDTQVNQQEGVLRQVNICADLTRSSLVQVEIDSIENGRKTVDFNARLDARSVVQALQLSLKWNPQYSRQLLATLLQLNQQSQQTLSQQLSQQELIQELIHKYSVIGEKLVQDFALEPITKILVDEIVPIFEEFGITQQLIQQWFQIVAQPIEQVWQIVEQYLAENVQEIQQTYQEVIEQIQQRCQRSKTCSKVANILGQIENSEDFARIIAEPLVQLLQKTHRIVAHSQGKLIRQLPEINWSQFVPESVQEFVQQSVEAIYIYVRQSLVNPQTGTTPFSGIVQHIEVIVQELFQTVQWRQVRWERIQQALEQAVQLLVSPRAWASSVRVLVWDPQNGQLQVQIQTPQSVQNQIYEPVIQEQNQNSTPFTSSWSAPRFWSGNQKNIPTRTNAMIEGNYNPKLQQYFSSQNSAMVGGFEQGRQQPQQSLWQRLAQQQQQRQQQQTGRYI